MFFLRNVNTNLIVLIITFLSKINSNHKIQVFLAFNSIDKQYLFRDEYYEYYQYEYKNAYKKTLSGDLINITNNLALEDETKRVWYSTTSDNEEILIEFFYPNFPLNFSRLFEGSTFSSIKIKNYNFDEDCFMDFSYMFKDCKNLISIDLSDFTLEFANNLTHMFSGCSNLKYLFFPKTSFKYDANLYRMFSYCTSLTSIDLTNLTLDNAYINDIFYSCNNLESVEMKGYINNLETIPAVRENEEDEINLIMTCERVVDEYYKKCPNSNAYAEIDYCYYINAFETISLKKLNLFDMKLKYLLNYGGNSLEECLFYKYFPNIKKCSKFIGFHYCGACNNNNNEVYCTKTLEETDFNFYYLEDQLYIPKNERTCLWSNNIGTFKNYIFNNDIWLKCNERCETCLSISRSEINHKCLTCNKDNKFYPSKKDFDDFINKKINSINCFKKEEVESNYFINENGQFENCDISCAECISKNNCIKCIDNYYKIYEKENGTCFHYPLDDYELITYNSKKYLKKCDKYCTKYINNLTISSFKENITETILEYLEDYENDTIGIIRGDKFSNYIYNQSSNYSIIKESGLPIFDFSKCIETFKTKLNINISIFVLIIEYDNEQIDKNGKHNKNSYLINSTEYQLFLENGTILNYSICDGLNITVEKKVDYNRINEKDKEKKNELEKNNNISIYDNKKIIDYCFPLILYNKDYSLEQRIDLTLKIKPPCDEDCSFQSFNSETNYSTCICPIKLDKDNNEYKIESLFDDNDYFTKFKELYENGNLKYFKCIKSIIRKNEYQKHNWLKYISIISFLIQIIIMFIFFLIDNKKIINIYDEKIKEMQNNKREMNKEISNSKDKTRNKERGKIILKESKIINSKRNLTCNQIENVDNKNNIFILKENYVKNNKINFQKSIDNEQKEIDIDKITEEESINSEMNSSKTWKNDKRKFCQIFCDIFCDIIFIFKDSDKQLFPISLMILMINFSFHTFLFVNALLFNDSYITDINLSKIKSNLEYIFVKETKRLIIVSFICICIIRLLLWFLSGQNEKIEEAKQLLDNGLQEEKYISRIETLRKIFKIKNIIGQILLSLLHFFYIYFIIIFGNINSHIQIHLFITMLISIYFYFIFYSLLSLIISIVRFCSIKHDCECWYNFSKYIQNVALN